MKIKFLGAAGGVTGSNYLVTTKNAKFLVDCGLFQGGKEEELKNQKPFDFNPAEIDFVILTHAHIDHSGRLPKLVKEGFRGPIYTTLATRDLCEIMLLDSAKIQENDVEWQNRKRIRAGKDLLQPLYTVTDAENAVRQFQTVHYYNKEQLAEGVTLRFADAGHILGSAIVELWLQEEGKETKVIFSGDIGLPNRAIIRDPDMGFSADYLIMESTYGNTVHQTYADSKKELIKIIMDTAAKGGTVVIPAFAVGRAQEIIYQLNEFYEYENKDGKYPSIPVYMDSPMAVEATKTFINNSANYDETTKELIRNGDNPFEFKNLHYVESVEESRRLNTTREARVIISSSGMATAGRVRHHLKHNLWDPDSAVVLVGYQANGTLGRMLRDGVNSVKLFGEEIAVRATIYDLPGFSAHADEPMLLSWVDSMERKPEKIFLVHGEEDQQQPLKQVLEQKIKIPSEIVTLGQEVELEGKEITREKTEITTKDKEDLKEIWGKVEVLGKELLERKDSIFAEEGLEERYGNIYEALIQIHRSLMDIHMHIGK